MGKPGSSGGVNYLSGLEEVMKNLNIAIEKIEGDTLRGLVMAAAFIRRETETTPPKTPRDLGNLVNSWFVVSANEIFAGAGASFVGKDASEIRANHSQVIGECKGIAKSFSVGGKRQGIVMGYSVNYAGFIHEMYGATKFTRKGSDIKWLEHHIKKNKDNIIKIIANHSKIKK